MSELVVQHRYKDVDGKLVYVPKVLVVDGEVRINPDWDEANIIMEIDPMAACVLLVKKEPDEPEGDDS